MQVIQDTSISTLDSIEYMDNQTTFQISANVTTAKHICVYADEIIVPEGVTLTGNLIFLSARRVVFEGIACCTRLEIAAEEVLGVKQENIRPNTTLAPRVVHCIEERTQSKE